MIRVMVRSKGDDKPYLLYYIDPASRREISRSAGTRNRMEAERAASKWEAELTAFRGEDGAGWDYFRERFEDEHLALKAPKTRKSYATAMNAFHRLIKPGSIAEITASHVSQFKAMLLAEKVSLATVANYLTHIRGCLNWAASIELIPKAPRIQLPSGHQKMKGRPLTEGEFKKMLAACDGFPDPAAWKRLLKLLWLSGLRLGEAMRLTWDGNYPRVDLDAKPHPHLIFSAQSHKSRREDTAPIAPDFAAWLQQTPPEKRQGLVSPCPHLLVESASARIVEVGTAAGVVTTEGGKAGSAQDFRRSYGTRWAPRVRPATLQRMMRHASLATTMKFYVALTSADASADLWGSVQPLTNLPDEIPESAPHRRKQGGSRPRKRGKKRHPDTTLDGESDSESVVLPLHQRAKSLSFPNVFPALSGTLLG